MPTRPFKQARGLAGRSQVHPPPERLSLVSALEGSQPCKCSVIRTTEAGFKEAGAPPPTRRDESEEEERGVRSEALGTAGSIQLWGSTFWG